MNKRTFAIYICVLAVAMLAVTVITAAVKPSINKTVILQVQKYIKK